MNIRRPAEIRKKKDKRNSRKQLIIAGGSVLFLLVVIGLVVMVRQSSIFRVYSVAVSGVSDAYGQQIMKNIEAFSKEHSSMVKLLGTHNMIAWGGSEREFLNANPDLKEMRIQKDYFKHAIVVEVIGREKFGAWCQQGGGVAQDTDSATGTIEVTPIGEANSEECYWFDTEGVLFARAPVIRSELFNRVFDSTGRSLTLRDKVVPDRLFKNLIRIFKLLEMAQINTKTVYISDLALEEATADSVSDPRIIFSLRFDPTFTLSAIDALKKSGEWGKLQYANFTVENKVSYK